MQYGYINSDLPFNELFSIGSPWCSNMSWCDSPFFVFNETEIYKLLFSAMFIVNHFVWICTLKCYIVCILPVGLSVCLSVRSFFCPSVCLAYREIKLVLLYMLSVWSTQSYYRSFTYSVIIYQGESVKLVKSV